jgi:hypothetical protein
MRVKAIYMQFLIWSISISIIGVAVMWTTATGQSQVQGLENPQLASIMGGANCTGALVFAEASKCVDGGEYYTGTGGCCDYDGLNSCRTGGTYVEQHACPATSICPCPENGLLSCKGTTTVDCGTATFAKATCNGGGYCWSGHSGCYVTDLRVGTCFGTTTQANTTCTQIMK